MKPDHDRRRRREMDRQSDPAETRDAGVQVDLRTQHFSRRCSGGCGAQWRCVPIRADEPSGCSLLQQINLSLPQTVGSPALYLLYPAQLPTMPLLSQSEEALHGCCLPSMLQCCVPSSEGEMCSDPSPSDAPAVPPGLIAPLSPCLAEEEEEEEEKEEENNICSSADRLTLKRRKMSRVSRTKSQPTNHTAGKPRPSRRSLCYQKTGLMEDNEDKLTKEQEETYRSRKPAAGIQRSPAEGGGKEERVPEGIKHKTDETERAGRPRRMMIHPPVRYLVEYEEHSHGPSSTNQSRERRAEVKRKQMRMRRMHRREEKERKMDEVSTQGQSDGSRTESQDGGVERWRQRCQVCGLNFTNWASLQLHLSVHTAERTFSCQLCNKRFSRTSRLNLHRQRHHGGSKGGCHGSSIRAEPREAETAGDKEKRKKKEVMMKRRRLPEHTEAPDWSRHMHVSRGSCWWVDCKAVKKKRKMRGQEESGWMEWRRHRCRPEEEVVEGKRVCVEKIGRGQEVEQPQRPRRRTVGPPIRYLLESEEPSHGATMANKTSQHGDKIKNGRGAPDKVIGGGASRVIDRLEDTERRRGLRTSERRTSHMVAEGEDEERRRNYLIEINEDEEPQRPRRKISPIRKLLQSEEPSNGPATTNHNTEHKPKQKGRPTKVRSDAEGGASDMIDSSEAVDKQKGHMTSERETGHMVSEEDEPRRPRRKTVGPPIRYLVESEAPSYGGVATNHMAENKIRQSTGRPEKDVNETEASEMIDSPDDVARHKAHMVSKRKTEEEERGVDVDVNEKVEERPIRNPLEPAELPHEAVLTNHNADINIRQEIGRSKTVVSDSCVVGGASKMIDSPKDVTKQTGEIVFMEEREKEERRIQEENEKMEEQLQRPRRKTVGPPIRYLLESEEPSHGGVTAHDNAVNIGQSSGRSRWVVSDDDAEGGASKMIDRSQVVDGQKGHETFERETGHMVSKEDREEEPRRPRRTTVGPPIRYLLESEEPSHGAAAANRYTENKPKQSSGKPTEADGQSDAEDGASKMIDRSEVVGRQKEHMVSKEEKEEETQRPRRKMVIPPIRHLLDNVVTPNHNTENKIRPKNVVNDSDAGGGASEMIDRPKDVARQTGHSVLKEKREEEEERRIEKVNEKVEMPIRYLSEPEELSHGSVTANHNTENIRETSERSKKVVSDAEGGTLKMIDRSEVVERQKGHETLDGETGHMVSKEEREKEHLRPRRMMVGPPIRYLLESEEPSHGGVTTNHVTENKIRQISERPEDVNESGASEMIDSPEDAARQRGHMVSDEEDGEGNETKKTVGPPISYLLQPEEPSHDITTANHNKAKEAASKSDAEGGASPMIDRHESVDGQTVQRDEAPQRPRRKMVGPPIRYLLESEALSYGAVTTNHTAENKIRQSSGKPVKDVNETGASEMIDSPEDVARQKGHMVSKRKTEEEKRGVDVDVNEKVEERPIRNPLESEELPHEAVLTNHNADINIRQGSGRSNKVVSESLVVGGASEMIDSPEKCGHMVCDTVTWSYLAHRDLQSGQVTTFLPCCVSLQRIL